jgi:MoaA/NifB/PqqE/SkfB family radical SAM enzyme
MPPTRSRARNQNQVMPNHRAARQSLQEGVKLVFELTDLCNFMCVHCIREEGRSSQASCSSAHFLAPETIRRILAEVEPYGMVDSIALTGGEPTIHPRFAEIVSTIADSGYMISLVTNGWDFPGALESILAVKPFVRAVTFSLDGATEATHDAIRNREGSFRAVMSAITSCQHHGLNVQINMTVTRSSRSQLVEMALLASRLGCSAVGFAHCQPTPGARAAGLTMTMPERLQVESDIADIQRQLNLKVYLAGDHHSPSLFVQCPQLCLRELNIDYRGFLTACCVLSGFQGGAPDTDVVADLNRVSIFDAHQALITRIAAVNQDKINRLRAGTSTPADHFMCSHCLKHYGKVPDLDSVLLPSARDGAKE